MVQELAKLQQKISSLWSITHTAYKFEFKLLNAFFNKFTIKMHYLLILHMHAKYQDDKRLIIMSSINF